MTRSSRLSAIGATLILVGISPLFLLLMLANRLCVGRTFFRQVRLGHDLRPFVLLKFQTMVDGADAVSTITVRGDPRVTPYGRILRLLKLDELPQLINVIRGEMAFVGPRPLTPNEIERIPRPLAEAVYRTRPGLVGISALAYVDEEQVLAAVPDATHVYFDEILPRKIALELAYVQRRTWWTDLLIVLATPLAAVSPAIRRLVLVRLVPEWEALMGPAHRGAGPIPSKRWSAGGG